MGMKIRLRRMAAGILACLLLFSAMSVSAVAAEATKRSTSRAIAIVFDNSGSMYMEQNKAWCRATYAIEVFASMMNEGDVLQVYPMYDVTVNGITYTSQNPFTISGGSDTSVIQTMYTPYAGDTPIETIGDAYNGLKKQKADERWLIVLTDGAVFYENEVELGDKKNTGPTKARLEEVLTEYNRDVNVLYLGIDTVGASETVKAVIPEVTDNGKYLYHSARAANSADTLTRLTEMCNMIFGRDLLKNAGNKMTFDVSMKKLILFVQGNGISNVDLKNASGASVGKPSQAYSPRYGELGAGTVSKKGTPLSFSVDNSLSGYIAVYDLELDAGTYTMSYPGDVSSVSVYYEPDVNLEAYLVNEYGDTIHAGDTLYPGAYTIRYGLVDKNGEMTTSELLGKTNYTMTYTVNGESKTVKNDQSGTIELELAEGDTLDGKFSVTYLSGYTITKSAVDFGWPSGGFKITPRPVGTLELKVSGGQSQYKLSELENASYAVQLLYEGVPLTAEQLADANLSVAVEGGNAQYALEPNGDGYLLNVKYAGTAAETDCGSYVIKLNASFINEFEKEVQSGEVQIAFDVEDDGYGLEMEVEGEDYFVISELDESEPLKVFLTADGQPLTDEQLAATTLTVDGLACECTPVPGESAFEVRIAGSNVEKGKYTLAFRAVSHDQVGREIAAESEQKVTLQPYPRWLPVLIVCLALLVLFALIWLYLSIKVLPKKIVLNNAYTKFRVDGAEVSGAATYKYTGGGKKSGTLTVRTPNFPDAAVNGGFTLNLQAASPRRTKSSKRRAVVVKMTPINLTAVTKLTTGSQQLTKEPEDDGVIWKFRNKEVPNPSVVTNFEIGNRCVWNYRGMTEDGRELEFSLDVQLQFK